MAAINKQRIEEAKHAIDPEIKAIMENSDESSSEDNSLSDDSNDGSEEQDTLSVTKDFQYKPSLLNLYDSYEILETLCDEKMSPATIYKVKRKRDGRVLVMKVISKSKLFGDN